MERGHRGRLRKGWKGNMMGGVMVVWKGGK